MAQHESQVEAPKRPAARLRELLSREDHITVCPGVYDGLTARVALHDKFECLYMVRQRWAHFIAYNSIIANPTSRPAPAHRSRVSAWPT